MNSAHVSGAGSKRRIRWWQWLLGLSAAGITLLAIAVVNAVTLVRDAVVLRDEIVAALATKAKVKVQVSAGPLLLSAVRSGLSFVKDMPEDARMALRAVRKASVGVYTIDAEGREERALEMFAAAAAVMERRGWARVVAVNEGDTQVLVFAPTKGGWTGAQKVCVAVCDDDKLVVVTGTIRPEPLMEIAARRGVMARFL